MRFLQLGLCCAGLLLVIQPLQAQQKVVAHFNMGRAGAVTYAIAPDSIMDANANGYTLIKKGQPVFFADAPADKKMLGEGAVLLDEDAGYRLQRHLLNKHQPFILELWVQANARQQKATEGESALLSLGNGTQGYELRQDDKGLVVMTDGDPASSKPVNMKPGEWYHIALVTDGKTGSLYVNSERQQTFRLSTRDLDGLTLGATGNTRGFRGLIYEVRLSQWHGGKFDAGKHLLYNKQQVTGKKQQALSQQRQLVARLAATPGVAKMPVAAAEGDWLVKPVTAPAQVYVQPAEDGMSAKIQLSNGLVSREFLVSENLACVGFNNRINNAEYLRAIKPEARIKLDSTWFDIGGLSGQPEHSYLMESWYNSLVANPGAFRFTGMDIRKPEARYPWQLKYHAAHTDWPPKGVHLIMYYTAPVTMPAWKDKFTVAVHYELYEGMPVIAKWLTIENKSGQPVLVSETECEVLAVNQDQLSRIHVESDYSFALANADPEGSALMHYKGTPPAYQTGRSTTAWREDPEYHTWASHNQAEDKFLGFPHHNLLVSRVPMGPAEMLPTGQVFSSFVTFELLHDNDDRERQSLAHRRFYRKLAPQVTESLITGGITSQDRTEIKRFIDQMHELGFERLDIQAWPGISHDRLDTAYVGLWKDVADYAAAKGIVMGGYELQVASRGRGAAYDCIDPQTSKPGSLFGQSVCIASKWQDIYYPAMWKFFEETGLKTYNMDGPYHGDACAATDHPYHRNLFDSQWEQWKQQVKVLHELQRRNMYVPIPDWYFLNGQSATGMGYREASANLTPQQQLLLGRQYIYDGTWHKTPTMGWLGLQLVGFYSNDPRVGLEPLSANLDRYEVGLFQHLASGCQFTVRGKRLYDTPETRQMVQRWINWFKEHREILTSDIIHLARPTGRDLDAMFHVNSLLEEKGMLVIFNPTDKKITRRFKVPLYYTGITGNARVTDSAGNTTQYIPDHQQDIFLEVSIPAGGFSWYVMKAG
ncbi:LamG domain-containing protein [Chitinophaga qingshengii]|uniref:LamG domain-containing protein n=1 Tax=Chitinophaga qingshengii TaxID=1569794 RepID=A0ABR7TKT8_9BACT|nr:LamG domain-containing protein [Chitinophaga qingshengii]MBC9930585.1 LamG domain-containing protein [Chitinophaga qingshengii]